MRYPVLLAAALLASGCEKKTPPAGQDAATPDPVPQAQATAPADESTVLIGVVASMTGGEATFGQSTFAGITMAVDEVNAAGGVRGKKVVTRLLDSQSKAEEAGNAALRLITQEGVKLLLGEIASSNSIAMAEKAQPAQVPMIAPSSTAVEVTQKGDYIFRVCFIDPFQGFVMAKFAREHLKLNKVAVLKDTKAAYSVGLADVFIRKFSEMGGKIVGVEAYQKGDTDFRGQLTALRQTRPDGIFVPGYYSDVGIIMRQARELGLRVPLLGGDGWDSERLVELGGSAAEGHYFSNHYSPEDPSPRVQKFLEAYKARFGGRVPDSMAAMGYDAAKVGLAAMGRAKDLGGPSVRDAIAQTRDFPGVTGTITLDDKRNAVKPAVVLQVQDGKFRYVTTISP